MANSLQRGLALLRAPANEVGYALRATLRWRRGTPRAARASVEPCFPWAPAEAREALAARAAGLVERFDLATLQSGVGPEVFARNLARLEALGRLGAGQEVPHGADGVVHAVDVGAGDFHYATALQRWLSVHGAAPPRPVVLRGIELDGHGIYRDGHSRADHADAHAALAVSGQVGSEVCFEVADASRIALGRPDVVTMFFPFVTPYACLAWGAPLSRLRPRRLLRRAVAALRPGGWLVVVNQTAAEHVRLCRWIRGLPLQRIARRSFASDMVPESVRTQGQVGAIWRKCPDVHSIGFRG